MKTPETPGDANMRRDQVDEAWATAKVVALLAHEYDSGNPQPWDDDLAEALQTVKRAAQKYLSKVALGYRATELRFTLVQYLALAYKIVSAGGRSSPDCPDLRGYYRDLAGLARPDVTSTELERHVDTLDASFAEIRDGRGPVETACERMAKVLGCGKSTLLNLLTSVNRSAEKSGVRLPETRLHEGAAIFFSRETELQLLKKLLVNWYCCPKSESERIAVSEVLPAIIEDGQTRPAFIAEAWCHGVLDFVLANSRRNFGLRPS